ncbi:hypothetical protein G6F65_017879 [Rhizopus arrhizus]|nr:hypothetical protein G6F65_017879 [Rhizopus arrhizus]
MAVGQPAHCQRNHRATDDGHHQQARRLSGECTKAGDGQGEDGREHDGVEQADADYGPLGQAAACGDRDAQQDHHRHREQAQQMARVQPCQQRRPHQAAGQRAAPVQRNIAGGFLLGQALADARRGQEIDQHAADGHLGPDVAEDGQHAQAHVAMAQHVPHAAFAAGAPLHARNGGQAEHPDRDGQQEQRHCQAEVRQLHRLRFGRAVGQCFGLRQQGQLILAAWLRREDQQAAEQRRQRGAQRVHRLRQGQPAGAGALVTEQRDIGIGRHLQHGDAGGQHEQRRQEQAVHVRGSGRPEHQRTHAGDGQAGDDAALVAERRDQPSGRQ